jgi:hypothetical protein
MLAPRLTALSNESASTTLVATSISTADDEADIEGHFIDQSLEQSFSEDELEPNDPADADDDEDPIERQHPIMEYNHTQIENLARRLILDDFHELRMPSPTNNDDDVDGTPIPSNYFSSSHQSGGRSAKRARGLPKHLSSSSSTSMAEFLAQPHCRSSSSVSLPI